MWSGANDAGTERRDLEQLYIIKTVPACAQPRTPTATSTASRAQSTTSPPRGGAGFLGSHLRDPLVARGDEVLCFDNFSTERRRNGAPLPAHRNFELLRHDVTFPLYVEVDEIDDPAGAVSPVHYRADPVRTTRTSVHGTINMLGPVKRTGAELLPASTSEVHGEPSEHPQVETWGATSTRSAHAPATTRAGGPPRPSASTTIGGTVREFVSRASSTPTDRG